MKKSSILGLIVISIAISILISLYATSSNYGAIRDAKKTSDELHIVGYLDRNKELYYNAIKDANYFSFYIKDNNGEECKVIFTGTKPEDFERVEKIVLVGKMEGKDFHASHLTMKCPSKYTQDKLQTTEVSAKQATI